MMQPKHLDVLQNIEFAIVEVYRRQPDLPDYDVDDALAALIDDYRRDADHPPREHRLKGHSGDVYQGVKLLCDIRLGRGEPGQIVDDANALNTPAEIVTSLTTVRKSVARHGKTGGRQGYLRFINTMMP